MAQFINRQKLTRPKRFGIRCPIRNAAEDGVFDITSTTIDRLKSALYVLLFTEPGSRVMMPEFGSPIYSLHFEQVSEVDFDQIESDIRAAVKRWIPDLSIQELTIRQLSESPNTFEFNFRISLAEDPDVQDSVKLTVR